MTSIKQRHLEAIENQITFDEGGVVDINENKAAEKCESITEDIAIKFAEWIPFNVRIAEDDYYYEKLSDGNRIPYSELFQLFKTETGL